MLLGLSCHCTGNASIAHLCENLLPTTKTYAHQNTMIFYGIYRNSRCLFCAVAEYIKPKWAHIVSILFCPFNPLVLYGFHTTCVKHGMEIIAGYLVKISSKQNGGRYSWKISSRLQWPKQICLGGLNLTARVLARDPSTHLLDGLFHLWTGKKKRCFLLFVF